MQLEAISVHSGATPLLRDLSLRLDSGRILAVIGANGAGKTSLLRTLSGELIPACGALSVCGATPAHTPTPERARQLAVLPQLSLLNFPYKAEEVVALGRTPHSTGRRVDAAVVTAALRAMDIEWLRERLYTRLSGGEKQRVQLARVMAQVWRAEDADQRLLLLDEPTAALDLGHQQQLMQALRRFADQGVSVVMVVHDLTLAARYADSMLALDRGRAVALGTPAQVLTAAVVEQLFQVQARVVPHPDTGKPVLLGV